ncbi:myogenesis-regulating glycosidase-like [Copidosoma floridanum]|uniref:myogenesis-regulating glycosidase-like n=1 Tax=Copidosoma floridanum TaxID=29053 RepID=UPI0006C99588|nr:myogenesis-regulating glycosidase-like [Copidosoma floridanum]
MKSILFCAVLALLVVSGLCCEPRKDPSKFISKKIKTGTLSIETKDKQVVLSIRKNDGTKIEASLFTKNPALKSDEALKIEQDCERLTTCIQLAGNTYAKIKADPENEVVYISRVVSDAQGELDDCFSLDDAQWYGGPQWRYQHWPIQHMYYEEESYVTTHPQNMALAERYWLSSKGIYVFANESDPLFLDQNNLKAKHLCLIAKNKKPYQERTKVTLNYEIGVFSDPRTAHTRVIEQHFGKPTGRPSERMVTHPIWSTWARYKVNVNDKVVREFAQEIIDRGFSNSQIEIDDNWETCYGSAVFDPNKFPDVTALTTDLKNKGFRVTLWIHPFINKECDTEYNYALDQNYFVRNETGNVETSWWQGPHAAAIDFTNPKAVEWWVGRLKKLQALGIDSFKFDAGETSWLPEGRPKLTGPSDLLPGIYTLNYTSNLASHFDDVIEVRVGWRSQKLPIFVRMIDKDSRWTWNNGLPTLITTLLQMNLNGYVFVLPDMIGGNGYVNNNINSTQLPSKELFIRWLQANAFMPSLQYSFVPWDYDAETIKISKTYTDLHAQYSPNIIDLMKKAVSTGAPINPPIWWVDPTSAEAHKISDEYLLGEDILVAPVIEEGATSRHVFLPRGRWKDPRTGKVYVNHGWLNDYPAPLDVLPYFIRVQ